MKNQILVERLLPDEANIVVESSKDFVDVWLGGVIMQAEIKNRNGRIYPLSEISNAVKSLQEAMKTEGSVLGELDHPEGLQINLDRVSHMITEIRMDKNAVGKLKLMNTPMGNIARELVRNGIRLGISSRGAGEVMENSQVKGFSIITADLVATPSAQGARMSHITESVTGSKKIMTLAEQVRYDAAAQKYFQREVRKFIEGMKF